ncbi:NUDIX hydrolase [Streptomyces sp. NPDC053048]|uniref:NUDIX hydrolase n=1 Tax=Streptomyces sp. NPDC053048 TaxID=3365694 RepID=UPI0037D0CDDD
MTPPIRQAARVIALDDQDRVLLLRYDEGGGFWATPGGSLDEGEDHQTALRRELHEELGVDDAELGTQVAERSQEHEVGGQTVRQVERYYLARLATGAANLARATLPDTIRSLRWWTVNELRTTSETVYPGELGDLVARLLSNGTPANPITLGS